MTLPNHIAIIMDGNGRWGLKNYNNRIIGHRHGVENIKDIIKFCLNKDILNLTLFAFSRDNIQRSKKEVNSLFSLFTDYYKKNHLFFDKHEILIKVIGEKKNLPAKIYSLIKKINKKKIINPRLKLNIAFNYSAKEEIISAINKLNKFNKLINKKNIEKQLYTHNSGDPEILIRTGGKNRLSDFLLWQISYSEIFFLKKMWPDFKRKDLDLIIKKFKKIKRNFGNNE